MMEKAKANKMWHKQFEIQTFLAYFFSLDIGNNFNCSFEVRRFVEKIEN